MAQIEEFFRFNVLHGRSLCGPLVSDFLPRIQKNKLKISDDLVVLTVSDIGCSDNSILRLLNLEDYSKIIYLTVPVYIKWISKIETLFFYIKNNYNSLPNYILYVDGSDTLILKDIENPKQYLDFYKCKILFNIENIYTGTGYEAPNKEYLYDFNNHQLSIFLEKNKEKYGNELPFGLNAGVFLGEKNYVLNMLEEAYNYMKGDIKDGFPYGCTDDQYVCRYLHTKYYDIISADIFNIFSFWGGDFSMSENESDAIFNIGYTNKYLNDYLIRK